MTAGFFDGPRLPSLASYCADVDCAPSTPCADCIALKPCDACGEPSAVLVADGTTSGLPLCCQCHRTQNAEDEAARWGSWRPASAWFAGTRFINVGMDVYKVRFAAGAR